MTKAEQDYQNLINLKKKVEKGLECCMELDGLVCRHACNYHDSQEAADQPTCIVRLASDALKVLKFYQPRVMPLECNQLNIDSPGLPAFTLVEEKGRLDIVLGCISSGYHTDLEEMTITRLWGASKKVKRSEYGKTWRCWSYMPTEEQRKVVKWDE